MFTSPGIDIIHFCCEIGDNFFHLGFEFIKGLASTETNQNNEEGDVH